MTYIANTVSELARTLGRKNADYAPTDEFSNFRLAGELAGVTAFDAMLIQIGIKYSRLLALNSGEPEYESFRDSLVDLAGYAVITAAWLDKENNDSEAPERTPVRHPHWYVEEPGDHWSE